MSRSCRRVLLSSCPEPFDDGVRVIGKDRLDERSPDLVGKFLQALPELGPGEILQDDHVVAAHQVVTRHCNREVARDDLRLFDLVPPPEMAPDVVDIDDQRECVFIRKTARQRRLAHTRRAVDQQEQEPDGTSKWATHRPWFTERIDLVDPGACAFSWRASLWDNDLRAAGRQRECGPASPGMCSCVAVIGAILKRRALRGPFTDRGRPRGRGALGLGVVLVAALIAVVPATPVAAATVSTPVAAGGLHSCALTAAGGVKCWGDNSFGELGDGTTTKRLTPVAVVGLSSGVVAIAAGGAHTCALTIGGAVKCWGFNAYGQLGDGTTRTRLTPVDVVGLSSGVSAIAVGGDYSAGHTCALTSNGAMKCWGSNEWGQLGDGTTVFQRSRPGGVVGLSSGVVAIATGENHSCALTAGRGVKCWGQNFLRQLGDGTTTTRYTPVSVVGLSSGVSGSRPGIAIPVR